MSLKPGDIVQIHSYKHNKKLHRIWNTVKILSVTDDILIAGNNKTKVIESNGRYWITREPAICFFFKEYWFNIIGMLKQDGIYYYCNISSPFVWDDEAIKYIDYDLDLKVYPDWTYQILDEDEYAIHMDKMNYPEKMKEVIEDQLQVLIDKVKKRESPFNTEEIKKWYEVYEKLK